MKDKNKIEEKILKALHMSDDRTLRKALIEYDHAGCDFRSFAGGEGKLVGQMAFHGCLYGLRCMEMNGENLASYPELVYKASSFYCKTRTVKEYCMCIEYLCEKNVGNSKTIPAAVELVEQFARLYKTRTDANDYDIRCLTQTLETLKLQNEKVEIDRC